MDFTFGIITGGGADANLRVIIDSIRIQGIPNYEIIIIGQTNIDGENIITIPFDESQRYAWITRKKNMIAQRARYNNIVLIHDYIIFHPDWYKGFLTYGDNFQLCITQIQTPSGERFRDYTIFGNDMPEPFCSRSLIPYNVSSDVQILLAPLTYVSGSYYVVKKYIALKFPLNEKLSWCQCEDLDFSLRLRNFNIFPSLNKYSKVLFLKEKPKAAWEKELTDEDIDSLSAEKVKVLRNYQEKNIIRILSKYL